MVNGIEKIGGWFNAIGLKRIMNWVALNTSLLFNDNDDDRNNIFKLAWYLMVLRRYGQSSSWLLSAGFDLMQVVRATIHLDLMTKRL